MQFLLFFFFEAINAYPRHRREMQWNPKAQIVYYVGVVVVVVLEYPFYIYLLNLFCQTTESFMLLV